METTDSVPAEANVNEPKHLK